MSKSTRLVKTNAGSLVSRRKRTVASSDLVVAGVIGAGQPATGEDVLDLAHPEGADAGPLQRLQHGRAGGREGEAAALLGAGERPGVAVEGR